MSSVLDLDDNVFTTQVFIPEEWIRTGKKYTFELPSYVQHAKNMAVSIPPYVQSYFPPNNLPVLEFIALQFPKEKTAAASIKARLWFSENEPTVDPKVLYSRAIPRREVLEELYTLLPQVWLDGAKSVADPRYNNGSTYIPLWAIAFWRRVAIVREQQQKWLASVTWCWNNYSA